MNKKKNKSFNYILLVLFLLFLGLYFSSNAGLIDYQAKHKTNLTEKQIAKFEEDIKNNANIDIKDYIDNSDSEYDNNISKTTLKVSNTIGEAVNNILNFMFDKIEDMRKN